jgi:crotonobetainyl-CoA:carnitine CoA-transferase CaiB-like acyl-CoA transferase
VPGPLAGITVLDLTRLLPGGYCTLLLADLGAGVIKVEEPGRGDYLGQTPLVEWERAAYKALNRGKRSITLNLKDERGRVVLRKLVEAADVLVESFRPGVLDRLGVGHEALSALNPALVYCAISGYGQDGPYRDMPGHDINYLGYGGVLSITGAPGGPPALPGVQVGDMAGGMFGALGILAALLERRTTGRGSFVDAAILDAAVSWLSIHAGAFLAGADAPTPGPMPLAGTYACYRVYRARDGRYLTVGALEPRFWRALCDALECPEFVGIQFGPQEQQQQMAERLQAVFDTRERDEWLAFLGDVPTCIGPVNDVGEALADPQVLHRNMVAEVPAGPVGPGPALKFYGREQGPLAPAPGLSEHTAEVLATVGVQEAELRELRSAGVV